ncbi:Serine protease Do-like HtrA [Bhargavaea cecembensis DSE10]|uniref:Serine protease Do-like HtrA n=1 Tax=Bhargavaea cecembensis DSE10 TaxID=1235279 RepID=M7NGV4_9BACL|nr:trypsin-like peptidase domain-containing protein [Bhargavaea cecembensis]EMR06421.1 Serine protease Do-like HtrA [Bhargavaea cecembensis DSE10]
MTNHQNGREPGDQHDPINEPNHNPAEPDIREQEWQHGEDGVPDQIPDERLTEPARFSTEESPEETREEAYRSDMPGAAEEPSAPVQARDSREKKKRGGAGWLQAIGGGVAGSVLTMAIAVPLLDGDPAETNEPAESGLQSESQQSTGEVTKVSTDGSLADMVEQVSGSIVGIVNYQQQQQRNPFGGAGSGQSIPAGTGSGVIIKKNDESAYIVTNNHVVEGASKLEVSLENGERAEAELVGADALSDLAVVRVDANLVDAEPLAFGDSDALRAGDSVVAIGNPLGLELSRSVTEGIVSATDRSISVDTSAGEWEMNVIQTDAAINQGNSGGALVNMNGEVIGINSLKIGGSGVEGLGFAIPSNDVVPLVEEMMESGHVERPYAGISMYDVAQIPRGYLEGLPNDISQGVYIAGVDPEGAAAKGGIKEGDVITAIDGEEIEDGQALRRYLYSELEVGDQAVFTVYREGKKTEVPVTLGSNKASSPS